MSAAVKEEARAGAGMGLAVPTASGQHQRADPAASGAGYGGAGYGQGSMAPPPSRQGPVRLRRGDERSDEAMEDAILAKFEVEAGKRLHDINHTVDVIMECTHAAYQRELRAELVAQAQEAVHECPRCHNKDPTKFIERLDQGDVVCNNNCGAVVIAHQVHGGEMYRKFKDDTAKEDRSHHGKPRNKRFSDAWNLRTEIPRSSSKLSRELRNAQDKLEMNLSNYGKDERKTRVGFKELQKKQVFEHIDRVGLELRLGSPVLRRAKDIFCNYRDAKEQIHNLLRVVAVCIIAAYREGRMKGEILSLDEELRVMRRREEENRRMQERRGLKCSHCHLYFPTRSLLHAHECRALTPEQRLAWRAKLQAKANAEAKRRAAEKGKMLLPIAEPVRKRRRKVKKKVSARAQWLEE